MTTTGLVIRFFIYLTVGAVIGFVVGLMIFGLPSDRIAPGTKLPPVVEDPRVATCARVDDDGLWLYDCTLPNGTRCVVLSGGVDCDWDSREGR